jgi:hypothetical protein
MDLRLDDSSMLDPNYRLGVPTLIKRLAQAILKNRSVEGEKRLVNAAFSTLLFDFDEIGSDSQAVKFAAYAYDLRKRSLHSLADRLEEISS